MLGENTSGNLPGDVSNPFITKPSSPKKSRGTGSTDSTLASLRQGMGQMNISSKGSSIPYTTDIRERKDSKDTRRELDRFVPARPASLSHNPHSSSTLPTLAIDSAGHTPDTSTDHSLSQDQSTLSLQASLGLNSNRRILSFRSAPPLASHATSHLDAQRNYLLQSTASASRGTGSHSSKDTKKRAPPYMPERVLDAPGFEDDYYLNLIDWSCANRVAIGLGDMGYVWDAETGSVSALGSGTEEDTNKVTSVSWSNDGAYLAIGLDTGDIEIWDVEENKKMRTMKGHLARVPAMSWHGHVLTSGCRDGSIYHHDVRVAKHKVMELVGHNAEVCGLAWRSDGQFLASGGNDNVVNCWDGRIGASILNDEGTPRGVAKWTKRNHTAAVKAIAWSPWQSSLLATGGGTADKHIHFWSTSTGARTASLPTSTQVTSLTFSPHSKEILGTHGYPDNTLTLWAYPTLEKIWEVPAHDSRIISSALSPDGTTVCTGAGDENLKFWKVWEVRQAKKERDDGESGRGKTAVRIR
ncbi:cell division control protein [Cryptococcus deuterogattii 99/473]|uniref:Cell division control protein n=1 Tax=Cryptococcus deuterogattii Ram5 TaxID=1296110 RepID=A0A0D0V2Q1_9TREE|nr:cell division control protein [Cryptococcus deuterogattii LA55]KIR33945.1 cell division control protein [Cryptococcus deuterogattii MMRL2647]KIR41671.1 cell division control protein [Cryptococcus deuterogattii Ram5]KIR91495.1 cell division control protein [Cryptococcus deuterogattii CBS 10090]KIR98316.1 cell division control protein [Cryptococcus deuterogattii 2001/935-1]KIY54932.1 cell division control protein [Cryptococcus deuterogattii 99/473]